jgi:uroporphyrinogen-III synthase
MDSDGGARLPLAGRRILITRAPHQASGLADCLRGMGAVPVLIPTIEIGPPGSFAELDAALGLLSSFDVVAFTSANAVESFHRRALALGIAAVPRRIAVVGRSTARAVEGIGLKVDVIPPVFNAGSLGEKLLPEARGRKILLALAEQAPAILQSALVEGGAHVTIAATYVNRIPEASLKALAELFASSVGYPDAVTFTSASTAENLVALLDAAGLTLPAEVVRASIGPITSGVLRDLGLPPHFEAGEPTIAALASALAAYFDAEG